MAKLMLHTLLWVYAIWYAAALVGSLIGAPMLGVLGPVLGTTIAMAARKRSATRLVEAI